MEWKGGGGRLAVRPTVMTPTIEVDGGGVGLVTMRWELDVVLRMEKRS